MQRFKFTSSPSNEFKSPVIGKDNDLPFFLSSFIHFCLSQFKLATYCANLQSLQSPKTCSLHVEQVMKCYRNKGQWMDSNWLNFTWTSGDRRNVPKLPGFSRLYQRESLPLHVPRQPISTRNWGTAACKSPLNASPPFPVSGTKYRWVMPICAYDIVCVS